jgi:hypothetical protein
MRDRMVMGTDRLERVHGLLVARPFRRAIFSRDVRILSQVDRIAAASRPVCASAE